MADKAKSQKEKYLDLLFSAGEAAASKTGNTLSKDEIFDLYDALDSVDATKIPQWLALNKDKLSMIPEVASLPEFISVSENPKVVEKDFGFTEGEDFYKMDGAKSWMNKSIAYLQNNADKYGLSLGEYLDKVRELATKKEQERQWEDNAKVATFNAPGIGDVNVPGLTAAMLPTSFNKAQMGQEVTPSDIAYDVGTDVVEGGTATYSPVLAALMGNAARQGKGIYDNTQDKFSVGQLGTAGLVGGLGLPVVTKAAGDLLKRGAGFVHAKPVMRLAKSIEDIGEVDPKKALVDRVKELNKDIAKKKAAINTDVQSKFPGMEFEEVVPTATEAQLYGTGSKLWRNVKSGEILTDQEYQDALRFMKEYKKGPNVPESPAERYNRGVELKSMPEGDLLINAWAEPKIMTMLRNAGQNTAGVAGGRYGIAINEDDKKAMAKQIINSTDWAKYITGQPNNLTEEQIYLATMYGE